MADSCVDRRALLRLGTALATTVALGGLGRAAMAAGTPGTRRKQPNIVYIMADDLGYADLSVTGRTEYQTPAIDSIARDGIRFTSAYANSAVCSATRTALITGRYQYRLPVGLEEPLAMRPVGLPPSHPTLPSLLKQAGYRTALVGKWHLGSLPDYGPLQSGYDRFFGIRQGGADYFTHKVVGQKDLWDGDQLADMPGYLTTLFGDRAVATIEDWAKTPDKPFFLSLHFNAPHWPWESPDSKGEAEAARLDKLGGLAIVDHDGGDMATYAAMMQSLDHEVGRVLATLKRLGLDDNTIVVFTSDNGGERFSKTWPFTGYKTELMEGGMRVPAFVRWPGVAKPDTSSDVPIMSMDWMPTFLAAAGTRPARGFAPDGTDITAQIGGATMADRPLFWRYNFEGQHAMREGPWKYLKIGGNEFLFDIVADPQERANLKDREPERFQRMQQAWTDWNKNMLQYDAQSYSHGMDGATMVDRYGIKPAVRPDLPQH